MGIINDNMVQAFFDILNSEKANYISKYPDAGIVSDIDHLRNKIIVRLYVMDKKGKDEEKMKWSCDYHALKDANLESMALTAHMVLEKFKKYLDEHSVDFGEFVEGPGMQLPLDLNAAPIVGEDESLFDKKKVDMEKLKSITSDLVEEKCFNNEKKERPDKDIYYCNIARDVATRSTCLRRKYCAVIVKIDRFVSTGYNGAPRGAANCCDKGVCKRQELNVPAGERYELCVAIHAEQNAIMQAGFELTNDATLYLAGINADSTDIDKPDCCMMCKRMVINAGIKRIFFRQADGTVRTLNPVERWIKEI